MPQFSFGGRIDMGKKHSKLGFIALLALPFFLFAAAVAAVVVRHGQEMAEMMSLTLGQVFSDDIYLIIGAFAISFAAELGLLFFALNSYARKAASLENLSREQEQGAKLLVRRDLELTRANEQLRKLDEIKSGFISVVAHQLRTPLSGVKWTINLLLSGDMGGLTTEQKTFLMKAYESNDRMISLVNDMLGADRIDSGKVRYLFRPVQLIDVIDNVLFELLPQANAKGLAIRFSPRPDALPKVHADPEKLRAVFQNLLENAVKYSRPNGVMEVGLRAENGEEVRVWIRDNGIGIPKDQQKNIFERFFRAQNAIKAETDGSGLGLFIVKSIIERHGGRIWFESEEGKGVTFYFTVPVEKGAATSAVDRQ